MSKRFTWTVEFSVDEVWVADGFNLTQERALSMLANDLSHANIDAELAARVIKAPPDDDILNAQGYHPDSMTEAQKRDTLSQ